MNVIIRKADIHDAEALAFIGKKTFLDTWTPFYDQENIKLYVDAIYHVQAIRDELQDPAVIYYAATDDDQLIGFVKLSRKQELAEWITDRCIEICRIYVLKEYLDKRVGRMLMETSIKLAAQEKVESIVLGVWENNYRALAFYKKFGFEKIGEHPFVMGNRVDTDWVIRKKISP